MHIVPSEGCCSAEISLVWKVHRGKDLHKPEQHNWLRRRRFSCCICFQHIEKWVRLFLLSPNSYSESHSQVFLCFRDPPPPLLSLCPLSNCVSQRKLYWKSSANDLKPKPRSMVLSLLARKPSQKSLTNKRLKTNREIGAMSLEACIKILESYHAHVSPDH